ncbi:45973_t:CDS:2, partial [Gigaspora margarita]
LQKNKCELCLNEMLWEWDEAENPDQWTVDRIDNKLDYIERNIHLVCLECMAKIPKLAPNLETIEISDCLWIRKDIIADSKTYIQK